MECLQIMVSRVMPIGLKVVLKLQDLAFGVEDITKIKCSTEVLTHTARSDIETSERGPGARVLSHMAAGL